MQRVAGLEAELRRVVPVAGARADEPHVGDDHGHRFVGDLHFDR
jgi:hypothetical protein